MSKIFLIGPQMKNDDDSETLGLYVDKQRELEAAGHEVVSVVWERQFSDFDFKIKMLLKCDEVHVLQRWHTSQVAKVQFVIAMERKMKITMCPIDCPHLITFYPIFN